VPDFIRGRNWLLGHCDWLARYPTGRHDFEAPDNVPLDENSNLIRNYTTVRRGVWGAAVVVVPVESTFYLSPLPQLFAWPLKVHSILHIHQSEPW
jgi:hypothetical protein